MPEAKKPAARAPRPGMKHRNAVKRMLAATGLRNVPEEAPLVALIEELAHDMDYGGGARVRAEYLSAQKDIRRVLDGRPSRAKPVTPPKVAKKPPEPKTPPVQEKDDLQKFKEAHRIPA